MILSIVIVNYNTRELLRNCLASVLAETSGFDYEIIVVDNASKDDSRELLEREFPHVRCIFNSANRGFAAANNQGIAIATGEFVLLLNSDTKVIDGALQRTVEFMKTHPEASIVGCKLLNADGSLQPSCMSFPTLWNLFSESFFLYQLFDRTRLFGQYHMTHFDYGTILPVDVVKGAFMMIRRAVFDKVGGFDEAYFMYTEETDLCYRAKAAGFQILFYPFASIVHFGGGSVESIDRLFEQYHSTQVLFIRKNFRGLRRSLGVFLKMAGIAVRIPVYYGAGVLKADQFLKDKSRACARAFVKALS